VVFLDGKKEKGDKLFGEIFAAPFLAERRMVALENLLSSSDKDTLKQLIKDIEGKKIPDTTVLLVWQGEPLGKIKECKTLHEVLSKEKYAQEFKKLEGADLAVRIKKQIADKQGKISNQAAAYLAQNVKSDMWLLSSLTQQLAAYKRSEEITLSDVQLFLEEKEEDNVFNMADAVVGGNRARAFKILEDLRRGGEDDHFLFSMVSRQFKILLEIKDALEKGHNPADPEKAKVFGLHPFVIKKSLPVAKKYSRQQLADRYYQCLQADIKVKTGQGGQSELLDLFIGKC
jgi:DNA polymerase III subunit delta